MKNNRGFTLVELLAVIVILAVILVIAIPNVMKIIDKAKLDSYKRTEDMLVSAAQKYMAQQGITLNTVGDTTTVSYNTDLRGNKLIDIINDQKSKIECSNSKVIVTKTTNGYTYKPGLVCDNYISLDSFNIVNNGDFSNGTTGWLGSGSGISANNNILTITGTTSAGPSVKQNTSVSAVPNQQVYFSAKVRITNSNCNSFSIYTYDNIITETAKTVTTPIQGVTYSVSGVVTQDNNGPLSLYIRNYYTDIATATGKMMEIQNVVAIDMGTDNSNPFYGKDVNYMDNLVNKSR
jgi:prepilin-type N-terminal cleavage/methylation domain-containing protein